MRISDRVDRVIFFFALLASSLMIFMPSNFLMPRNDIDLSWMHGMNEVVSRRLSLGTDIVFPFGPYASIYNRMFHPETYIITIYGSMYLSLYFFLFVNFLMKDINIKIAIFSIFFLTFLAASIDAALFSIPLIFSLFTIRFKLSPEYYTSPPPFKGAIFYFALTPFGLLPLIKGSMLVLCTIILSIFILYFVYKNRIIDAIQFTLLPIVTMFLFWIFSGQKAWSLQSYLFSMFEIVSGYSDAMSKSSDLIEVVLFISFSLIFFYGFICKLKISGDEKILTIAIFSFYLFISFKAGFTRHDWHAIIPYISLLIGIIFLAAFDTMKSFSSKTLVCYVILIGSSTIMIGFLHSKFCANWRENIKAKVLESMMAQSSYTRKGNIENIFKLYSNMGINRASSLLYSSLPYFDLKEELFYHLKKINIFDFATYETLEKSYKNSKSELIQKCNLPDSFKGSVDIYSYRQGCLLALNNYWSPRPIFQSYAAYTPSLIKRNNEHLLSTSRPENILFKLETIDARLPSMDDGLSWLSILKFYTPSTVGTDYIHLIINKHIKANTSIAKFENIEATIGDPVNVPFVVGPVFVEINFQKTKFGKLFSYAYKSNILYIEIISEHGEVHNYRINPNMTSTGFILSPLVLENSDFQSLFNVKERDHHTNRVKSFKITTSNFGINCWENNYSISFFEIR